MNDPIFEGVEVNKPETFLGQGLPRREHIAPSLTRVLVPEHDRMGAREELRHELRRIFKLKPKPTSKWVVVEDEDGTEIGRFHNPFYDVPLRWPDPAPGE